MRLLAIALSLSLLGCGHEDVHGCPYAAAITDSAYASDDTNFDLANPERGIAYWIGEGGSEARTLEYNFLWLGTACSRDLVWNGYNVAGTSAELNDWYGRELALRAAGKKSIFRPRYDSEGAEGVVNGCGKLEADSYTRMQAHAAVIATVLKLPEIKPTIGFIEMGYLGSWGEWNSAGTNPACDNDLSHAPPTCRTVAPTLLAATVGQDRISFAKYVIDTYRANGITEAVALRRPGYHYDLANLSAGAEPSSAMGFHDDCFLSNSSDAGTFTTIEGDYLNYTPPLYTQLTQQQVIDYLLAHAPDGSNGGEPCDFPVGSELWLTAANVPPQLDSRQYHYLHAAPTDFRDTMIAGNQWDAIRSRLGYRYELTSVSYPATATAGSSITLTAAIDNVGFARMAQDRPVYVVLRGATTNYVVGTVNPKPDEYTLLTPTSQSNATTRSWQKGATTFTQIFPAPPVTGTYAVHLYIPDPDCVANATCDSGTVRSDYAVKLATLREPGGAKLFDATTGTNDLGVSIDVTSGGDGGGDGGTACE